MSPLELFVFLAFFVALIGGFLLLVRMTPQSRRALLDGQAAPDTDMGALSPKLTCPHCKTQGQVSVRQVPEDRDVSIKDLGMMALVGPWVAFMAKRKTVTQCHCGECGVTWRVK